MSKSVSYYDWELKFRSKKNNKNGAQKKMIQTQLVDKKRENKKKNALGIVKSDYRRFMEKWKKKNLP